MLLNDQVSKAMRSIIEKFGVDDDIVKIIVTNGKIHSRSDAKQQRIVIARDDIKITLYQSAVIKTHIDAF